VTTWYFCRRLSQINNIRRIIAYPFDGTGTNDCEFFTKDYLQATLGFRFAAIIETRVCVPLQM
jgi:hypothetical protein